MPISLASPFPLPYFDSAQSSGPSAPQQWSWKGVCDVDDVDDGDDGDGGDDGDDDEEEEEDEDEDDSGDNDDAQSSGPSALETSWWWLELA